MTISGAPIVPKSIFTALDFPTPGQVITTRSQYQVLASVTDNNPTRTNTGDSFVADDYIVWDGSGWNKINGTTGGSGTVTSVSVTSANGLAGSVATPTTTPAITLSTTVTGILKGNATAISAASAGTDYANLAYKTVAVSGQTDVVATNAADTLTLVAGTNVTLTTTPGLKAVTITAAGTSAGGSTGQIQYNNGGAFGGFGSYNSGTGKVILPGDLDLSPGYFFRQYSPDGNANLQNYFEDNSTFKMYCSVGIHIQPSAQGLLIDSQGSGPITLNTAGALSLTGSVINLYQDTRLKTGADLIFESPDGTKTGSISQTNADVLKFSSTLYSFANTGNADQLLQISANTDDTSLYIPYNLGITAGGGTISLGGNVNIANIVTAGGNLNITPTGDINLQKDVHGQIFYLSSIRGASSGNEEIKINGGNKVEFPRGLLSNAAITTKPIIANSGAAYEIDPTLGNYFEITLTAATPAITINTSALPSTSSVNSITIVIKQDATGGRIPTFGFSFQNGVAPYIPLGADEVVILTATPIIQGPPGFWVLSGDYHFNANLDVVQYFDSTGALATSVGQNDDGAGSNILEYVSGTNQGFSFDKKTQINGSIVQKAVEVTGVGATLTIDPTAVGGFARYVLTTDVTIDFNYSNIPASGYKTSFEVELNQPAAGNKIVTLTSGGSSGSFVNNSFFSSILPMDNRGSFPTLFRVDIEPTATPSLYRTSWTPLDQITKPRWQVLTTDATATTIATIPTSTGDLLEFEGVLKGLRTGGAAGAAGDAFTRNVSFGVKNVAGTVTVGTLNGGSSIDDQGTWTLTGVASGTNALLKVTGAVDNNITWDLQLTQKL